MDVGQQLDRFLDRTTVAAAAANVTVGADKLRREAEQKQKTGQSDEARKLLRQAGEMIMVAVVPLTFAGELEGADYSRRPHQCNLRLAGRRPFL